MRTPEIGYLIAAATAISVLASCSGGPSAPATSLASQQNQGRIVKHQTACPCVYVANYDGNSINVFPVGTSGNVAPSQYIYGSNTELNDPTGVAVDSNDNVYVANYAGNSISIYAAGATGNATPTAVISGSNTGLEEPAGVAIDPLNGDIYVENYQGGPSGGGTVNFYAPGSNGNVAPLGSIAGSNTELDTSVGLALDSSGNIYVPNIDNLVTVYAAGSSGNVAPATTISGSNTQLDDPYQVALDSSSNIYVANEVAAASSVTAYPAGANGNVRPKYDITGKKTKLEYTSGVALDANNNVYASDEGNSTITFYPAGSTGNVKPTGTIKGAKTKLDHPWGIAIH